MYILTEMDKWIALAELVSDPSIAETVSFAATVICIVFSFFIFGFIFGTLVKFPFYALDKFCDIVISLINKKRSSRSSSEERDDSSELPEDK